MLASTSLVKHLLKGLVHRRLADHGVSLPRRKEPFTAGEAVKMLDLNDGDAIGTRTVDTSSRFWAGWRLVDTCAKQAGPRKSEFVGTPDLGFTRSDVHFYVAGKTYADPDEWILRAFVDGRDRVTLTVGVSKADADGTKFGPNLIASMYNSANPMSFASAMVAYELLFPCRGTDRKSTWLFTPDGTNRWTPSGIDATLRDVMAAKLTPAERAHKSFHSNRIWVATGLKGLPRPSSDGEVQAFVRWSSVESLRVYARLSHAYQAARRDALLHARVDTLNATNNPQIDPEPADLAAVEQLADEL